MLSALISCTVYTVVGCCIFRIYLLIADDGGEREYNVLVTVLPLFILVYEKGVAWGEGGETGSYTRKRIV